MKRTTAVGLLAAIAACALLASRVEPPSLGLGDRGPRNEAAAIRVLEILAAAQQSTQASGMIDCNGNGIGEYGYLAELAGAVGLRDSTGTADTDRRSVSPPVPGSFGNISQSALVRGGYLFKVYLPDADSRAVPEGAGGGVGDLAPDPDRCEKLWCCYAWPSSLGNSGRRTFFVNQSGLVLATHNRGPAQRYDGTRREPDPRAAFQLATSGAMTSTIAANASGLDRGTWTLVR